MFNKTAAYIYKCEGILCENQGNVDYVTIHDLP